MFVETMATLFSKTPATSLTYKAKLPQIDTDFFDYVAKEDERAAHRLDLYLSSLLQQRASVAALQKGFKRQPHESEATSQGRSRSDSSATTTSTTGGAMQISAACRRLIDTFKEKLGPSRPTVLLPTDLTPRLARNIVRMVEGEERGIRGCAIVVMLHDGPRRVTLGKIVCDPTCVTTTLLYLHLNRVDDPANSINRSGSSSSSSSNSSHNSNTTSASATRRCSTGSNNSNSGSSRSKSNCIYISPGYTLEKRRKSRNKRRSNSLFTTTNSSAIPTACHGSSSVMPSNKNKGSRCNMGSQQYDAY